MTSSQVHELEIQKVEMQSEALLKEHELRRRDLVIMRYDRQRNLCDQIISRQRQIIEGETCKVGVQVFPRYAIRFFQIL